MYLRMHHLYSNEAVMTTYDDNNFVLLYINDKWSKTPTSTGLG